MGSSTFDIVLICVEAVMYIFHFTVFLLLVIQRNKTFKGAFYDLIRAIFLADFVFTAAVSTFKSQCFSKILHFVINENLFIAF